MLGLQVNSFVEVRDMDDANAHRVLASKMDIEDIIDVLTPHPVVPLASREEATPATEWDSDGDQDPVSPREQPATQGHVHGLVRDPIHPHQFLLGEDHMDTEEPHADVTPIRVHHTPILSPFGTPTSRVGFPSTAGPSRAAGLMAEKDVDLATEAGCTASSGGGSEHAELPPMEGRDVLELILRPDIASYRESRRQRNKTPYNEYPEGAVLELSDEDEDEVRMYNAISALPSEPGKVKKEPMSVAELDEKLEKRMKEELDQRLREANEEHAKKMAAIQAEMEEARLESARRHADLMAQNQQFLAQSQQFMSLMQSLQARPPVVYAAPDAGMSMPPTLMRPPSSSHAVYIPEHAYPAPALYVPPSPQVAATPEPSSHTIREEEIPARDTAGSDERDVIEDNTAIGSQEDEDMRGSHEDEHMRGSQDATDEDHPYVDTQGSQAAGDTLLVVEDSLTILRTRVRNLCPWWGLVREALLARTSPLKR